ncbi:MAG: ferric reductase-like transmembrane domain-containing protein [Pseudonocardia sp.]|nr:ferric reductase-like transmembrane domain-containing protein [Pseudonocardia sp.]
MTVLLNLITATILVITIDTPGTTSPDPVTWRTVARSSGLLALALLAVSAVAGVATSGRDSTGAQPYRLTGLHTWVAAFAVVFTTVHLASVVVVAQFGVGWLQLAVPFTRSPGRIAQACGVLAVYLMVAVVLTSALRAHLPWRWWQRIHRLAFPLFALATAHSVLAACITTPLLAPAMLSTVGLCGCLLAARWRARGQTDPVASTSAAETEPPDPGQPTPTPQTCTLSLLISQITWEADGIMSLRLSSTDGSPLPSWTPGAHIDVALPSGRVRPYSLYGSPADPYHYHIAVLRQDAGQGGSREMHDQLRIGTLLPVSPPRNHFPLVAAPSYLLLAGGIGITCLLPMTRVLTRNDVPWRLVYTGQSRSQMAFVERAIALDPSRVRIMPTDEMGRPDLASLIAAQPPGTAVYCCGPPSMIQMASELVEARLDLTLHTEQFAPVAPQDGAPVTLDLRRTGVTVQVSQHETLLRAVAHLVPQLAGGCEQGICGRCRATVLEGAPQHRDNLLTDREREAGTMLLCVSRARGDRLTLDL